MYIIVPQNCTEGDVRLADSVIEREGRLEVCVGGIWGNVFVYSSFISETVAYVICKQLGYHNVTGNYRHIIIHIIIYI